MELKSNVKEFIKRLFTRYSDDEKFRLGVLELVSQLDGYSITVLTHKEGSTQNMQQFKFIKNKPVPLFSVDMSIREYVDSLYEDKELISRLPSVCDKNDLYRAIIAEFVYINMTGFSVGIRLSEKPEYQGLFLETIKMYRVFLNRNMIIGVLTENKKVLLDMEKFGMEDSNNDYTVNNIYIEVMNELVSLSIYTRDEVLILSRVLLNFIIRKQLPSVFDNWISYGLLRVWSRLNIKNKTK